MYTDKITGAVLLLAFIFLMSLGILPNFKKNIYIMKNEFIRNIEKGKLQKSINKILKKNDFINTNKEARYLVKVLEKKNNQLLASKVGKEVKNKKNDITKMIKKNKINLLEKVRLYLYNQYQIEYIKKEVLMNKMIKKIKKSLSL